MKKNHRVVLIFVACLCAFSPLASAAINATSSATDLGTGVWQYTIDLTWSYDPSEAGVSHTDFDISGVFNCPYAVWDELGELTGNVYFDPTPSPVDGLGNPYYETGADGYTNGYDPVGEAYSVGEIIPWTGFLEEAGNGGPILRIEQTIALISPAPHDPYEVWTDGTGTFTYYSVFAPKDLVPDEFGNTGAAVTLKSGGGQNLYTESEYMTGQVPDCTTIPEPATLALLGLGGLLLRRRK